MLIADKNWCILKVSQKDTIKKGASMNKNLLRAVMAKNGDTQKALSEYLDISEQALSSKIHEKNNKGFSQIEIKKNYSKVLFNRR